MILYHGTNIGFDKIDLSKSRKGKDFGLGFYLTPDKSVPHVRQSENMLAIRKVLPPFSPSNGAKIPFPTSASSDSTVIPWTGRNLFFSTERTKRTNKSIVTIL